MKNFLLFLFLLLPVRAIAPDTGTINIVKYNTGNIYDRLINAIIQVESGGDTLAFNPMEKAYGAFQIRPIRLLDFNQRTGKKYVIDDCLKLAVSKEIFLFYATRIPSNFEMISRNWNGSGEMTNGYWKRVETCLVNEKISSAISNL